ncbi:hypothetical protein BCR24_06360 [Enterococcus ureilyticus]|uniref:Uncharacterized protein n=1 Tax=Enterococcus ureilyticus TaxID=1131292 RepID=A0A1E5H977_9ENTE|nr:hypothetical protein [Enterococcus ureilyticus]OEG21492.1 hypothetical protein BCR24_06360 [Enterococcus ureilyticus]
MLVDFVLGSLLLKERSTEKLSIILEIKKKMTFLRKHLRYDEYIGYKAFTKKLTLRANLSEKR